MPYADLLSLHLVTFLMFYILVILQGFKEAEAKYGLRDTQSLLEMGTARLPKSDHSGTPQHDFNWGHIIRKIECANHAMKCYRGALEKLVQENPQ